MKQVPDSPSALQSLATLFAGSYFAIVCSLALLHLALDGEFQFPVTRFHSSPVMRFADEPLWTAIWAGGTAVFGAAGFWVAHIGWTGLWKKWRS